MSADESQKDFVWKAIEKIFSYTPFHEFALINYIAIPEQPVFVPILIVVTRQTQGIQRIVRVVVPAHAGIQRVAHVRRQAATIDGADGLADGGIDALGNRYRMNAAPIRLTPERTA